jgi:ABC-type glycerol-3-phosphate transport system permease component
MSHRRSNCRHELVPTSNVPRPLLALFFMGIGMVPTYDRARQLWLILAAAAVITVLKAAIVWLLFNRHLRALGRLRAGSC